MKRKRNFRLFLWTGGILTALLFVTAQAVYVRQFFTEGESIWINMRYQQPVLLSSTLVVTGIFDCIVLVVLTRSVAQWWRSRKPAARRS